MSSEPDVSWIKTNHQERDDLKKAIRDAKISLREFKARARELRKRGYRPPPPPAPGPSCPCQCREIEDYDHIIDKYVR